MLPICMTDCMTGEVSFRLSIFLLDSGIIILDRVPDRPPPPHSSPTSRSMGSKHVTCFRYNIELSDLQILVGRARDNWQYAHTKSTSSLHLLDRFSISLQVRYRSSERSGRKC